MRISIVGMGFVGLVAGACLADRGHIVTCIDLDERKVATVNGGVSTIHETGLDDRVARNVGTNLRATVDLHTAVLESDVTFICVGTPSSESGIDLSYVQAASRLIGAALHTKTSYHVVIVKSTVVPGTTTGVVMSILEEVSGKVAGADFGVGMNPEFLTEGSAVHDFENPDRIVIGGIDDRSVETILEVYESFKNVERVVVNPSTAEMIKYASNAMLALAISFSNEIAALCGVTGDIDAAEVMSGVQQSQYLQTRVGETTTLAPLAAFFEAGCGFGGSCLPKDVEALVAFGAEAGIEANILRAVLETNRRQPERLVEILQHHVSDLQNITVAVLGLSFKPGTDDVRESPAISTVRTLIRRGARVKAYDPVANENARAVLGDEGITYCPDLEHAISDVDAVIIVTRWDAFLKLPEMLAGRKIQPLVIDGRRMLDRASVARYDGIGLPG